MKQRITILTPTYNRAHLLERLYASIKNQQYESVEWVIVDDGSRDNTEKLVKEFIQENKVLIKYVKKENGGKPSAHNAGVLVAESDLTLICDDDDYLAPNALKTVNEYWSRYNRKSVGGMIGYRGETQLKKLGGKNFGTSKTVASLNEVFRYGIFDTTQIYRTDILKENLFPITEGEKFVPEIWLWKKLDMKFKLIVIPEILEICEYQENGLTKSGNQTLWNNPAGYSYYFYQEYQLSNGLRKIKNCGVYRALVKLSGKIEMKKVNLFDLALSWPVTMIVLLKSINREK